MLLPPRRLASSALAARSVSCARAGLWTSSAGVLRPQSGSWPRWRLTNSRPKPKLFRVHAKCNAHQLGEEQDGHFVVGVEMAIGFTLVGIQVHLAHRADRDHHIGLVLVGG